MMMQPSARATKMAGGEFNRTEFKSLIVRNLTQSMSLTVESLKELWAKEFLPNIRKEIARKSTRLKPVFLTSKKGSTKLKSPKILFQRNTTLCYRRSRT